MSRVTALLVLLRCLSSLALRNAPLQMMARVPLIAGNWKMNTVLTSAVLLAHDLSQVKVEPNVEVAVFVPYPFLRDVSRSLQSSSIRVGAQSVYFEEKGAYTAAVSAAMLASVDCAYVLVGHSERRAVFGESDLEVNKNLKQVLAHGMKPILCVGETLQEYELGLTEMVCNVQLRRGLEGLTPSEVANTVIAYEPVWAIGTGKVATPAIAQAVHAHIRAQLRKTHGAVAETVRIQYGGSVTADSVDELMRCPDIDGALVGGASLTAASFARIVGFKA